MDKLTPKNVVYLSLDDDLQSVMACFKVNKISHVPVLSDNKLIGIVSKTDVLEYLYDSIENKGSHSFAPLLQSTKVKELMVQPVVEANVNDSQMIVLEKLISQQVGSVLLKKDSEILGIVTERDMLCLLAKEVEGNLSFSEKLGMHVVQWLDKNGIVRLSRMLSEVGI